MLLLLFRVLSELFFNRLTGEASRASGVEFIAEYANDLRRHSMVQDRDVVLNLSLIVLCDGAFVEMLSSSATNLFHIGKKCSWTHGLSFRVPRTWSLETAFPYGRGIFYRHHQVQRLIAKDLPKIGFKPRRDKPWLNSQSSRGLSQFNRKECFNTSNRKGYLTNNLWSRGTSVGHVDNLSRPLCCFCHRYHALASGNVSAIVEGRPNQSTARLDAGSEFIALKLGVAIV